jgi:hypothetical protein
LIPLFSHSSSLNNLPRKENKRMNKREERRDKRRREHSLSLVQRKKQEAKRKWTHFSLSSSYLYGLVVLFIYIY